MPHIGCPNKCSFCNQNVITGKNEIPHKKDVEDACETALKHLSRNDAFAEIAFFGGSFTAIDRDYMVELLDAAQPYIKGERISGIRISTRPDAINDEILTLLKEKGVTSIELGAQSMDDEVLKANMRGHTSQDVVISSKLIKKYKFSLGLQMMTGLYKSTPNKDIETAQKLSMLKPDTMRIYPTAILKNTYLASLYEKKVYTPYSFDDSIELCAELLQFFESRHIKVIRLGLHDSESLKNDYIEGVYHPSFRELCLSRLFYKAVVKLSEDLEDKREVEFHINPKDISPFIGNKKENILKMKEIGVIPKIVQDNSVPQYEIMALYNESERGKMSPCF
ncbi:MAG: radical SAM protein [Clostridia bacterium]|nr:radical SAM protein [Clostridia bacterium]